jgi:predicted aspartyl protease
MGLPYAPLKIENLFTKRALDIRALVDSGSVFMTVPEHVAVQIGFDTTEVSTREVVPANGHRQLAPMIGPLRVSFGDRFCDLSALVIASAISLRWFSATNR